jgi:threonine synthase
VAALDRVELEPRSCIVCVVTGHGLKDPETAIRLSPRPLVVEPDPDAIAEAAE